MISIYILQQVSIEKNIISTDRSFDPSKDRRASTYLQQMQDRNPILPYQKYKDDVETKIFFQENVEMCCKGLVSNRYHHVYTCTNMYIDVVYIYKKNIYIHIYITCIYYI